MSQACYAPALYVSRHCEPLRQAQERSNPVCFIHWMLRRFTPRNDEEKNYRLFSFTSGPVGLSWVKLGQAAFAATTLLRRMPIFSISSSTVSPALISLSPAKVPSEMMSPACIGV